MPAGHTKTKATRLLAEGRVRPDVAPARVFRVEGDHHDYTVVVGAHIALCACPAATRCSHIEAAVEWQNADPVALGTFMDALDARKAQRLAAADIVFAQVGA
jgi:hypothetical protein